MNEKSIVCILFLCCAVLVCLAWWTRTSYIYIVRWKPTLVSESTDGNDNVDDWQCSQSDLLLRTARFNEIIKDSTWPGCYTNVYAEKLYLADIDDPQRQNKLFFDVGANKGYTIAVWLSTWMPHFRLNQKNLYDFLKVELKIDDCGACANCEEEVLIVPRKNTTLPTTVTIHAFEPIQSTHAALVRVRRQFNLSNVHLHRLAISNSTGVQKIVQCPVGVGLCGLVMSQNPTNVTVVDMQTTTLDEFVQKHQIRQEIDLLKIDTEGADPLVLEGAKQLFAEERVRMLIFENHHVGMWERVHLVDVLRSLESKGFICHLIGKTGMIRLTKCWSPAYDLKNWSNVLCVHRRQKRLRYFLNQLL